MYSGNTPSSTIETTGCTMFCTSENRRYDDVVVAKTYSRMPRAVLRPAAPIQSISSINRRVHALSNGRYTRGRTQIADIDMAKIDFGTHKKSPAPTNCISEHLVASHGGVTRCITPDPALLPIWKDYPATPSNVTFLDLRGLRKGHSPLGTTSFSIFLLVRAKEPAIE